jgi:serine/threonine protein kinase
MGVGRHADVVHLIDFGLSKEYRDPYTHLHISFKKGLGFTGTTAFASINSHLGLELGRQDDLKSLTYVLFYVLWGFLPWQGLGVEGKEILESKQGITTHNSFQVLLPVFCMLFEHCHLLSFNGKPNYDHFDHLFNDLLLEGGFQSDVVAFNWDELLTTSDIPPA